MIYMYFFDAHCDTMLKICNGEPTDFSFEAARLPGGFFQIFACFCEEYERDDTVALRTLRNFKQYISNLETAEIIYTPVQAKQVLEQGKTAVMLALENCTCLGEEPENLYKFYNMGVRSITLTWNGENAFASGCMCKKGGLSEKGVQLIALAEKLGVLIDLSHLNTQSFRDVMELGKGKLFASHSSAYSVTAHPRNLTDRQISQLYHRGGVICACPNPPFIANGEKSGLDEFAAHIRHISRLTDGLGIGLGTDTDGISACCERLKTTYDLVNLPVFFAEAGMKNYEIENIFSCNLGRFLNIFPKK